jgi:hypothetical protein
MNYAYLIFNNKNLTYNIAKLNKLGAT